MHKVKILEKHCNISKDGVIALSNTLVETAIKIHSCPIRVTCSDYPGEEAIYSVEELLQPNYTAGPYTDKFKEEGSTYSLCMYTWKGVPVLMNKSNLIKETILTTTDNVIEKRGKSYVIKTPVVVTTFEEKEVSLHDYVGMIIYQTRKARGLSQVQLSNLIEGKASGSNIGQIESGTTNPILSSLEAIAEALGLHITELFPPK